MDVRQRTRSVLARELAQLADTIDTTQVWHLEVEELDRAIDLADALRELARDLVREPGLL